MIFIRSLLFLASFYIWLALCLIFALPFLWLPRKNAVCVAHIINEGMLFLLARAVHIRYEFRGLENLGSTPVIIASKHQSVWETAMWPSFSPHIAVVLKKELLRIPIFGTLICKLGHITVDRKGGQRAIVHMINKAKNVIEDGRSILIFPEGTRSIPGAPASYQRGIGALYRKLGVPVVPAALNSGVFWSRNSFLKYPGTIIMEFLPPIQPGLSNDEFMTELEEKIEKASEKLIKEAQFQTRGVLKHA